MSVIDSLIRGMKFNSDDPDDDDIDDMDDGFEDDEEMDERDSRSRFSFRGGRNSRQDDEDDYDDSRSGRSSLMGGAPRKNTSTALAPTRRSNSQSSAGGSMQVRIIKPSSFDQTREITDTLLSRRTVLLNIEGLDVNTAQRIVDYASGSCYALHGNMMKISHFIFVITPENVDISGDINLDGAGEMGGAANMLGRLGGMGTSPMPPMDNGGYMPAQGQNMQQMY